LGLCHPAGGGLSHGHRQHAQKFGKDRMWGSGYMLTDRQTDTHKHTDRQTRSYNTSPLLPLVK